MKINGKIMGYEISKQLPNSAQQAKEAYGDKKLSDEPKADGKEQVTQDTIVNLSTASKEAQLIQKTIASEPDVREDKVAELKERIQSGNYKIDHEAVASKLVDASLDEIF